MSGNEPITTSEKSVERTDGSALRRTMRDLKRRKVFRVAAAYAIAAWLIVEASATILPEFSFPAWAVRLVIVVALLGFPITLVLAWFFDFTPSGIVHTPDIRGQKEVNRVSRRGIDFVVIAVLIAAVAYLLAAPSQNLTDLAEPQSIAVLPFVDLSENSDSEYFSDGIAEELLNSLVGVDGLDVAARTSSFAYRDQNQDIRTIGQELNVDTVLEGSVRRAGDQIRITAQLINVENGFHLWSQTYDRQIDDIFTVQEEIARAIVKALEITLIADNQVAGLVKQPTTDVRAYDLYLNGRYYWHMRTKESLETSLQYFEDAVDVDDRFALAYTGIADAYLLLAAGYGDLDAQEAAVKAEPAIARALELDDSLGEAYASLGLLRLNTGELINAELALRKAISFDPDYAMAHMWLGLVLQRLPNEGLLAAHQEFQRAYRIDRNHPVISNNLADALANMGRYDEAVDLLERIVGQNQTGLGYAKLTEMALNHGRLEQAVNWSKQTMAGEKRAYGLAAMSRVYAVLGQMERARSLIAEAEKLEPGSKKLMGSQVRYLTTANDLQGLASLAETGLLAVPDWRTKSLSEHERWSLMWPGVASVLAGQYDQGAEVLERVLNDAEAVGAPVVELVELNSLLAFAYQQIDQPSKAHALLAKSLDLTDRARSQGWSNPNLDFVRAVIFTLQDKPDSAVVAMRAAVSNGWRDYWLVMNGPLGEKLRSQPNLNALLAQVRADLDDIWIQLAKQESVIETALSGQNQLPKG